MKQDLERAKRFRKLAEKLDARKVFFVTDEHLEPGDVAACAEFFSKREYSGNLYFNEPIWAREMEHRVMVCLMFAAMCENP